MHIESRYRRRVVYSDHARSRETQPNSDAANLQLVQSHYDETLENYRQWSPEGNLHFGYWRWGVNPFDRRRMLEEMNSQVFKQLRLDAVPTGSIADLGCGVGAVSRFGARCFPQLHWHAMNISAHQIEAARVRQSDGKIEYHCGDYHQLPWEDDSLAGAFFMESLCYSLRPQDAIAEVARVLQPGARLVITDGFLMRPLPETSRWFQKIFRGVAHNWAVPAYHPRHELDSWLAKSGLRLVAKHDLFWQLLPTAFQSLPVTVLSALKLCLRRDRNRWRWRQLAASGLSLLLGLQRHNFRYFMIVLEKPLDRNYGDQQKVTDQ